MLDDALVPGIAADLRVSAPAGLTSSGPHVLSERLYAFEGVHNAKGLALVVEANAPLCISDPEQRYVKPYISGEDLTADPRNPARFVIDLTGVAEH